MNSFIEFEKLWEGMPHNKVCLGTSSKKNQIGFSTQIDKWRIIYSIEVGPRLGIKELLWIDDTTDIPSHRIRVNPEMIEDSSEFIDITKLRAYKFKNKLNRVSVIEMCRVVVQDVFENVNQHSIERLIESFNHSIDGYQGGAPGSGKRR